MKQLRQRVVVEIFTKYATEKIKIHVHHSLRQGQQNPNNN